MTPSIECRCAHPDELDTVAKVWHESARQADGVSSVMPSVEELRARIDAELAGGWTLTIALVGGKIVGMLAVKQAQGVLDQLFVSPSAKRAGIGSLLLRRAMDAMRGGFTLRVASSNAGARRFYEHMGLTLASEGRHSRSNQPVCFYRWHPGSGRRKGGDGLRFSRGARSG